MTASLNYLHGSVSWQMREETRGSGICIRREKQHCGERDKIMVLVIVVSDLMVSEAGYYVVQRVVPGRIIRERERNIRGRNQRATDDAKQAP